MFNGFFCPDVPQDDDVSGPLYDPSSSVLEGGAKTRDRPLSYIFRPKKPWLALCGLDADSVRKDGFEAAKAGILACAVLAAETDQEVSYSRCKGYYAPVERYFGTSYTYASVTGGVEWGIKQRLLAERRTAPGDRGHQSTFWATPELMARMRNAKFEHNVGPKSSIRVKSDGVLIDFRETAEMIRMQRELVSINEFQRGHILTPKSPNVEIRRGAWVITNPKTGKRQVVPILQGLEVYRSFTRGGLKVGGRLYGVDQWQQLPKAIRRSSLLNGEALVEMDYSAFHPTMIYAMAGTVCDGDPYETGLYPREHGKIALNAAVSAKHMGEAIGSLAITHKMGFTYAKGLMDAVTARNAPIQAYFGKDLGVTLQRMDSEMMLSTIKTCMKNDAPVMPYHDSALVQTRHKDVLHDAMERSYSVAMGSEYRCRVAIQAAPDSPEKPVIQDVLDNVAILPKSEGVTRTSDRNDLQVPPLSLSLFPSPLPCPSSRKKSVAKKVKAKAPSQTGPTTKQKKIAPLPPAVRAGLPAIVKREINDKGELVITMRGLMRINESPLESNYGFVVGAPGYDGTVGIVEQRLSHGNLTLVMSDGKHVFLGPVVDPVAMDAARSVRMRVYRDPDLTREERQDVADAIWLRKVGPLLK